MNQPENPYDAALKMLDSAAEKINLDKNIMERLRHPRRCLIVSLPVMMDDGSLRVFEGYRVQHDYSRGPAKGGIRYHPEVTPRLGAYMLAVGRVAEAIELLGLYP